MVSYIAIDLLAFNLLYIMVYSFNIKRTLYMYTRERLQATDKIIQHRVLISAQTSIIRHIPYTHIIPTPHPTQLYPNQSGLLQTVIMY